MSVALLEASVVLLGTGIFVALGLKTISKIQTKQDEKAFRKYLQQLREEREKWNLK